MSTPSRPRTALPEEPLLGEIEATLRQLLEALTLDSSTERCGRPPILPALCLWGGLLVGVLHGDTSQLDLWRRISQLGLWSFPRIPISDQAVYHRLARDGTQVLERLLVILSQLLADRLTPYLPQLLPELAPWATDILVLDETTLDPVARRLPSRTGEPPATRRLPGKLAGLFDVRRQQWRSVQLITSPTQNEKVAAPSLLTDVPRGSLLLADLGYFSFPWFDALSNRGCWYISRLRAKTSYRVVHSFQQCGETFDGLVWLGAYRADRAQHLVRLVQYRRGNQLHQYITNVRDPQQLSMADLVTLYARRWDIELAVALIKQHLQLSLWWSGKDVVIQQQLFAVLIIAQVLQALRVEIAAKAEVDLFDVSLPLLVRYGPQLAAQGEDPVAVFVARGRAAGFIRPSRRLRYAVPDPPLALAEPLGSAVPIIRTPRYAGKA